MNDGKRKRMKRTWVIVLIGLALLFWMGVPAEAVPVNNCPGTTVPGAFVWNTDTPQTGGNISDGYNNTNCDLIIRATIPLAGGDNNVTFTARSVTVTGSASPPNVLIVDTDPGSIVALRGKNFVRIDRAMIKATEKVEIACTGVPPAVPPPGCPITVTGSELIATTTVTTAPKGGFGGPGGTLRVLAKGDISVTTTTFTGGELVIFESEKGSLEVLCGPGTTNGCKDPTILPLTGLVKEFCSNPDGTLKVPCVLPPLDQEELRSICFPEAPGVDCDGGSKQKDFIAFFEINFPGTVMTADRHFVIKAKRGPIDGSGSNLKIGGATTISVDDCSATPVNCIDLSNATINVAPPGPFNIRVGKGCIDIATTINLTGFSTGGGVNPTIQCK